MAGRHFNDYNDAREHLLREGFMPTLRAPGGMEWHLAENGSNLWARIIRVGFPTVLLVIETDYSLGLTDVEPG